MPSPAANVEEFERRCKADGGRIPCFCHGSNSVFQLRERLNNPFLTAEGACVRGFQRIFAGYSRKWGGGGVASLERNSDAVTYGSIVYLTSAEFDMLDRFEGIPVGANPFGGDFDQNRYRRQWVAVGDAASELYAIAYIRNNVLWRGFPSDRYLTACARNIAQFWPDIVASPEGLLVHDGDGKLRGRFENGKAVVEDLQLRHQQTALYGLPAVFTSGLGTRASKPTFVADSKFFDVHANLAERRGWTAQPFLRASQYNLKWRNYSNCERDFTRKSKASLLNHIQGSRCLGLKRELCWRLRAADLAFPVAKSSSNRPYAMGSNYLPQCWDLARPVDFFLFIANFVVSASYAAVSGLQRENIVIKSVASPCLEAVASLSRACQDLPTPSSLLCIDVALLVGVLGFGTSAKQLREKMADEIGQQSDAAAVGPGLETLRWPEWVILNSVRGTWVVKPGNAARGEGICVVDDIGQVIAYLHRTIGDSLWRTAISDVGANIEEVKNTAVAQQYIERPLLIHGKKFDIRQWVLVARSSPLEIWFFDACYLRFCADDYELSAESNLNNRLMHLTNNSVQKHGSEYLEHRRQNPADKAEARSAASSNVHDWTDGLMWHSSRFEKVIGRGAWLGIQQQMKQASVALLKSHQAQLTDRPGCFEWLGLDFVVEESTHRVFLLEANLSPDASHETQVLTDLCDWAYSDFFDRAVGVVVQSNDTTTSQRPFDNPLSYKELIPQESVDRDTVETERARRPQWECIYEESSETAEEDRDVVQKFTCSRSTYEFAQLSRANVSQSDVCHDIGLIMTTLDTKLGHASAGRASGAGVNRDEPSVENDAQHSEYTRYLHEVRFGEAGAASTPNQVSQAATAAPLPESAPAAQDSSSEDEL